MIVLFFIAAAAATSAPAQPAARAAPQTVPAPSTGPARNVIEAQLRSPPRPGNGTGLSADEADAIYKRYLASIGERPDRAPDDSSGSAQ